MMIAIWRQPQNTSHDSFKVYIDINLPKYNLFQYLDAFITTFDIYKYWNEYLHNAIVESNDVVKIYYMVAYR